MTLEVEWQSKIVKRLRREGAYARKASSTYAVGVLDLDVIIPSLGNVKIECKLEKGLKSNWDRKILYTEKQKDEAANIVKAGGYALGLIIAHYTPQYVKMVLHRMPDPLEIFRGTEKLLDSKGFKWDKSGPGAYLSDEIVQAVERLGYE